MESRCSFACNLVSLSLTSKSITYRTILDENGFHIYTRIHLSLYKVQPGIWEIYQKINFPGEL